MATNFHNKMANQHDFAMVPRSDIPRSRYLLQKKYMSTFNGGQLIPFYCEEILPGDHFDGKATIFARLATPIFPVMDNAELETFFFFVPNRIVWDNWEDFIAGGDFEVPIVEGPGTNLGFPTLSIYDYFGIPNTTTNIEVNALPFRAYNMIYNEWFRDQNLVTPVTFNTDDGPDAFADYILLQRMKKHDYFTSCLPWPQKGTAVTLPLGTSAPVTVFSSGTGKPTFIGDSSFNYGTLVHNNVNDNVQTQNTSSTQEQMLWNNPALSGTADLSAATAATINAIRMAFQVQRLLERDARGGTRYTELLQAHFGVRPPDFRLQRPEYIGGGKTMVNTHPIAQTSSTDSTSPQGNLAAFTTAHGGGHNFRYSATEHGYIIGLVNVRTDLTYQQGLRRHWSRKTRYDYYFPAFAHLGEQAVLQKEIYAQGGNPDNITFGFQERWAEYRYTPNEITGLFRSNVSVGFTTIDQWHYSEDFANAPALNSTFIRDPSYTTLARSLAVGDEAGGQQILFDSLIRVKATRPMPTYSVPGLIDHF